MFEIINECGPLFTKSWALNRRKCVDVGRNLANKELNKAINK